MPNLTDAPVEQINDDVDNVADLQVAIEPTADAVTGEKLFGYKDADGAPHRTLNKDEITQVLTMDMKTGEANPAAKKGRGFWNEADGCWAFWIQDGTEPRYVNLTNELGDLLFRRCNEDIVKKDLQSILDASGGSMILSGMDLVENVDGTIDLSAAEFATRTDSTSRGPVTVCDIEESLNFVLTDESKNYVYIDYGGGTPFYGVATDIALLLYDFTKQVGWIVTRSADTTLDVLDTRASNVNFNMKWNARHGIVEGYELGEGAALSLDASMHLNMTAGIFYLLNNLIQTPALDTDPGGAADVFYSRYRDGGVGWTRGTDTTIDYSHYDDGSASLATALSSKYTMHIVRMIFNNPSKVGVQYGQDVYASEAAALDAPLPPAFPPEFDPNGTSTPIYKIVTKADGSTSTIVPIAAVPVEGVTGINHNQLPGLQSLDAVANEYYHMSLQHATAVKDLISTTAITKESSGFDTPEDVIVTYDNTARTIGLTGTVAALENNAAIAALVSGWVSDANPAATPIVTQFLYYTGGTFYWSSTPWEFWHVQIAAIVFNSDGDYLWALRECHGLMQWQGHRGDHKNIGTYRDSGGEFGGYVLNSSTPADRRPTISECVIYDEDIPSTLGILAQPGVSGYTRLYYNAGGVPKKLLNETDIVQLNGTIPQYNDPVAGGYTNMTNNYYMSVWIIAVPVATDDNGTLERYVFINGQSQSASQSAQEALSPSDLNLGELTAISPEFTFIGQIILDYSGGDWEIDEIIDLDGSRANFISRPGGESTVVADNVTITGTGALSNPLVAVSLKSVTINLLTGDDDTTTFDVDTPENILVTGGANNHTFDLGDATTYVAGERVSKIRNASSEFVIAQNSNLTVFEPVPPMVEVINALVDDSAAAGDWLVTKTDIPKNYGVSKWDDFIESVGTKSNLGWNVATSGTTGAASAIAGSGSGKIIGLRNLQTGLDPAGWVTLYLGSSSYRLGDMAHSMRIANIAPNALSTSDDIYQVEVGFGDNVVGAAHTDAVLFRYHSPTSPNWILVVIAGGAVLTLVTSIPVTTATADLLFIVSSDGTRADFWINKVHVGTHSTGVPTGAQLLGPNIRILKQGGAVGITNRLIKVDAVGLESSVNEGRL